MPSPSSDRVGAPMPTLGDVEHYAREGWWISPVIVPDDLLDLAVAAYERHHAGEVDWRLPIRSGYMDDVLGARPGVRLNDYLSLQHQDIRALVSHPPIAATAAALARTRSIRLFHDQLVYKPPEDVEEGAVGWHTDRSYWHGCSSTEMLTAWVPLQDCTAEMGPICFLDGSHHWSERLELDRTFTDRPMDAVLARVRALGIEPRVTTAELRRGQVSFHHCRTIHGSLPNRSDRPRAALAIHLQDDACRHRPAFRDGQAVFHVNDLLCRRDAAGLPDYSDPDICPVLWSVDDA